MKISITFNGTYYSIMPDILQILTVKAYRVENAINLFNEAVDTLANDIQSIEGRPVANVRNLAIKYDLSNEGINFELDENSWSDYKKYLAGIEGRKAISASRKEMLLANGNITIIAPDTYYNKILSGDIVHEDKLAGDVLQQDLTNADPNNPFYDKRVVFTGVLERISRAMAADIVKSMGADINNSISGSTDFVIVGADAGPSKMKKIEDYNAKGANIRIICESEFLRMIE